MAIMTTNVSHPRGPSRSASFQKMLELEKKYKLERLQNVSRPPSTQRHPLPSAAPHHQQQFLPPQVQQEQQEQQQQQQQQNPSSLAELTLPEPQFQQNDQRSGSFSQEQNLLMLKAVRRSVALPSLSISIPPPPNASKDGGEKTKAQRPEQGRSKSEGDQAVVKSGASTQHKSVTFLAPDEASISDEESICQSPTWEGYKEGEKKDKERKKQKKKEKEQAAKEAKVAKKRLTARLSKNQPSQPPSKEGSPAPTNRKLLRAATEPLSIEYPQDAPGDAQHALAKLTGQPYQPSGKRPPSRGTNSFVGGVKLATQSEETVKRIAEARERAIERDHAAAKNPKAVQPKAFSITPGTLPRLGRKTPTTPSLGPTNQKEKEVSRPPITIHGLFKQNRSSSTPQAPPNNHSSEDILPEPNPNFVLPHNRSTPALLQHASTPHVQDAGRGRPGSAGGSSYVRNSREQSTERAISGFKDEIKVAGFFQRFRNSSQLPKESQSESQDAEKSPPKAKAESPEVARSSSPMRVVSAMQHPQRIEEDRINDSVTSWPPPPRVSSPTGSEMSSKASFRNARSQTQLSPSRTPSSPAFSFTSNMTSYFEHQPLASHLIEAPEAISEEGSAQASDPNAPRIPEVAKTPTLISEFNQATRSTGNVNAVGLASQSSTDSQGESRTSERSSASSYADSHEVSPPVSPVTTPDTSRPQSQKGGVSIQVGQTTKYDPNDDNNEEPLPETFHAITFNVETVQDDGKSQGSSNKVTKDQDDSWSRSALPIDIDEQSISTNVSNLDLNDTNGSKGSLPQRPTVSTGSSHTSSTFEDAQENMMNQERKEPTTHDNSASQRPQSRRALSSDGQGDISFLPPLKHQSLGPVPKGKVGSKPESRIFPVVTTQNDRSRSMSPAPSNVSRAETLKSDESETSSGPASYLQEARRSTQAPPPMNALKPYHRGPPRASNLRQSALATQNGLPDKPMAKMLVECCHCKFFHDMPSRLYECMATPDSFVEDKRLGVSGAITTMVKCPWCSHNMSKECCAGYMALVVLQQKLH